MVPTLSLQEHFEAADDQVKRPMADRMSASEARVMEQK
jgi:hypothetical protein